MVRKKSSLGVKPAAPKCPFSYITGPFYVYWLVDPRTNDTIYVGRGRGRRARSYYNMASNEKYLLPSHNGQLNQWISEIRSTGMEVGIFAKDCFSNKKMMQKLEKDLIKQHGRFDKGTGTLANRNNGG
ncbi:hypothetical protein HUE56_15120 [Azospirillum oryzae]|uniref:GIY-YIG domain-containing protein n=1 Tax=Azospirillum oryzae TaxID=286727 RepID=A0A6N1AJU0_9PROT|nr:hypothetical protein [Azospirillum oryzae]KAA0589941.1 hypothetical protein FZ938_10120 [Azospirillum oryzae]QKS51780.1 hypothetical protein HUE56_15120 [Azospirillum oryzae]GLR81407.1 hypothetical protein GCM10007856_40930 [Azospirillum oryzae]